VLINETLGELPRGSPRSLAAGVPLALKPLFVDGPANAAHAVAVISRSG
jgi:hypothetical protein